MKELTFRSPDVLNSRTFKAGDIVDGLDDEMEIYLRWEEGTWGTKIPTIIIRPKDRKSTVG